MSMYGDYIHERLGDSIYETDKGFATYRFVPNNAVYIVDVFVMKDYRNSGVAKEIVEAIYNIAREKDCVECIGTVAPSANGSTNSLKFLLKMGFALKSSGNDFIIFSKVL